VRESLGLSFRIEIDGGVALDTPSARLCALEPSCLLRATPSSSKGDIRENAKKLLESSTRRDRLPAPEQQDRKRF